MEKNEWFKKYLDEKFLSLESLNDDRHKEIIKRLDYTNGKVRKLEIWKGWITGGLSLLGILVGIFIVIMKNYL